MKHLCKCNRTQAQTLITCNSSKSSPAALKTVGSEFSWVTVICLHPDFTHTKKNTFRNNFQKQTIFLKNTKNEPIQMFKWPPCLILICFVFLRVTVLLKYEDDRKHTDLNSPSLNYWTAVVEANTTHTHTRACFYSCLNKTNAFVLRSSTWFFWEGSHLRTQTKTHSCIRDKLHCIFPSTTDFGMTGKG